jgi:hypothetical protein
MVKLPDQKGGTNARSADVPVWKRSFGGQVRMTHGARLAPDNTVLVFYSATSPLQFRPSRFAGFFYSIRLSQAALLRQTCGSAREITIPDLNSAVKRSLH